MNITNGTPTDKDTARLSREKLQELARAIHDKLPDGFGFMLLTLPFGEMQENGTADYVSNCNREDAIAALKTVLFRWGINEEWMKDAK